VTAEIANRVQLAPGHWKPRFRPRTGSDANDFDRVLARRLNGGLGSELEAPRHEHRAIADAAEASGRVVTATEAYQRAAWCLHSAVLWFEIARCTTSCASGPRDIREGDATPRPARSAGRSPVRRAPHPGILRAPRGVSRPPFVILVPGLDS